MTDETLALTRLRNQLRQLDYAIIPCHGKVPVLKRWNAADYVASQLSGGAKSPESWLRRFPEALSTGVRIERRLLAADLDIDDEGAINACLAALPASWTTAPTRFGGGEWKLALFGQVEGEEFVRVGSAKYRRPGDPLTKYHHIEIFGGKPFRSGVCSRQFACYGPRSYAKDGSVESSYVWAEGLPALHEVAVADLPPLSREQALDVCGAFETYAKANGWELVEEADEGDGSGSNIYDIDPASSRFEVWGDKGTVSYDELLARCNGRDEVRVSASFIPGAITDTPDRCTVYLSKKHPNALCIKDWKHFHRHYAKQYAPLEDETRSKIAATVAALLDNAKAAADASAAAGEKSGDEDDAAGGQPSKMPPRPRNLTEEEQATTDPAIRSDLLGERVFWLLQTHSFEGGNIVNIYSDATGRFASGMSERAARSAFLNWVIEERIKGPRGGVKAVTFSAFDIWMKHQYRIETVGCQMRPDRAVPGYNEHGQVWRNRYQQPRHWEVPVTNAEINEAREIIHALVANIAAAPEEQRYVLQHVAYKMQHPEVPGCGILFVNPVFGSGRDVFFAIAAALLGEANCTRQDISKLIGKDGRVFNAWVANKILAYVPEVLDPEHARGTYERLKGLVDPRSGMVSINIKGVEEYDGWRFASVWAATNHTDALRLEENDRRFSVLYGVAKALPETLAIRIEQWRVRPTAMPALWRYLKTVDLSDYKSYVPLKTAAKINMIEATKDAARLALQAIEADEKRTWKVFTLDQLEHEVEVWLNIGPSTRADKTRNLSVRHKAARAGLVVPVPSATEYGLVMRVEGKPTRIYCFLKEAETIGKLSHERVAGLMKDSMQDVVRKAAEAAEKSKNTTAESNVLKYPKGGPAE